MKDTFTNKMFFKLWWPGTLAAFPYAIGDAVDAIILGNHMGTVGLAAISVCVPIFMLYNVIMFSFGLGGANKFSILMGQGHIKEAQKCFNDIIKSAIIVGIVLAVIGFLFMDPLIYLLGGSSGEEELYLAVKDYFQILMAGAPLFIGHYILENYLINDNRQGIANIGSVVASIVNIPLTIILVVMMECGAAGAALSTVLCQILAIICYIPALVSKESNLRLTDWKIDISSTLEYFKSGFSVNVSYVYQIAFLMIVNNTLIRTMGEAGVAIFEMTQNVFYFYMFLWEGNAKAVQPLVSTYLGERYAEGINYVKKLGWQTSTGVGLLVAMIIIISPPTICYLFGYSDGATLEEAYLALRIYAVSAVIASVYMCYINFYQAVGDEQRAMVMNTIRGGVALLSNVFLFSIFWQEHIWYFYLSAEITAVVLYGMYIMYNKADVEDFDYSRVFVKTIENKTENMVKIGDELEQFGEKWELTPKQIYFLRLAVEELGVVMLKYGFAKKAIGYIHITVIAEDDGSVLFHMRDTAEQFNPFSLDTNKAGENVDFDMDMMGVMVLKKKAKDFSYRNYQGFNTMTLKF